MDAKWREYTNNLEHLKALKAKHPGSDLSWPFLLDGTAKEPTPAQERNEATMNGKFRTCERAACRRHRRCAFVSEDGFELKRRYSEMPERCQVFGTGKDKAERWSKFQMDRVLNLMSNT